MMRPWSLIPVLLVCSSCSVRTPQLGARISVRTTVRAEVRPPPPPAPLVAVQDAPVVEFFGIPLEEAGDIVFVLDVSGSMVDPARGRLAQIRVSNPSSPTPTSPPPSSPPDAFTPPPPVDPPPAGGAPPSEPMPPTPSEPAPPAPTGADGSSSTTTVMVTPRKIDVAQAELVAALERLPVGTRLNVVFFNSELEGYAPGLVQLDEQGRASMIAFVREVDADGSTALAPALRVAFMMNARRIVLLSDGLGNVGGGSDSVLRDARQAIRGGIRIDTIGLGATQDAGLLGTLAGESGGLYQQM